jgi:hypothetical protein
VLHCVSGVANHSASESAMAGKGTEEQTAAITDQPGIWKEGNSPTPNTYPLFLGAAHDKEHSISQSSVENFIFSSQPMRDAGTAVLGYPRTLPHYPTLSLHPPVTQETASKVSSIFPAQQVYQAPITGDETATDEHTHTHTPPNTSRMGRRSSSGSARAKLLQNLAYARIAQASSYQIQAAMLEVKEGCNETPGGMLPRHTSCT